MKKIIYMDNAATTSVDDDVLAAMLPYFSEDFGNPSSLYRLGQRAAKAVDSARDTVAKILGCKRNEVYFTSGGTESDNWAIRGAALAYKHKGNHIITSKIEHPAVLNVCKRLAQEGFEITYLDVDRQGKIDFEQLKDSINDRTTLVTIMAANNEVGTVQPYKEIGALCREKGILFHTDAVQAMGALDIDVARDNIDMLSLSAHKFHGPKGVGVLYVKNGIRLHRLIVGGAQERNMRGGTTNVPLIVGLSEALKRAHADREQYSKKLSGLRDYMIEKMLKEIPDIHLNGHRTDRLPNNVSFCYEFIEGEGLLLMLDMKGICVSSGSACASGSLEPSHVLTAMGVPVETLQSATRFSLGRDTTAADIDYTVSEVKRIVEVLRSMSPLFKTKEGEIKYV